jgi:hypothetical protein
MPRMAPPEGAQKLYIDERTFKKLNKQVQLIRDLKKALKKGTVKPADLSVGIIGLSELVCQKWDGIKLASGVKEAPVVPKAPAPKGPKAPGKAAPKPVAPAVPRKRRTPTEVARAKLDGLNGAAPKVASPAEV